MKTGKKIFVFSAIVFFAIPVFAFAAPSWWPIVPCGLTKPAEAPEGSYLSDSYYQPCNPCEIFHLGRNIIDFILMGLMPPVAAGLFIWGGFLILMGGPNPALFAKGKEIFTTTFYGVLIILGSWLITNTIMMSVAQDSIEVNGTTVNIVTDWNKFTCEYTGTAPTNQTGALTISPASLPDAVPGQNYSQTLSVSGGVAPYDWSATDAGGLPGGFSFDSDTVRIYGSTTQTGSFSFTAQVHDSTTPTALTGTKTYTLKVGITTACNGQTLAQKYGVPYPKQDASELTQLIFCVNFKLSGMIDQSQIYTYERTNDLCNYTRGERVCGSCAHRVQSCHYGGSNGAQGALGVDFNAKSPSTETQLFNALKELSTTCKFGYIGFETDHTHISSQGCSGN